MKISGLALQITLLLLSSVGLHAEQLPQFDTTKYSQQIFWLVIIFGILYSFMKYFVIPKLAKLKEQRKNRILDTLEKASKISKEISKIEKEINDTKLDILQTETAINDNITKKVAKLTRQKNEVLEEYKIEQKLTSEAKIRTHQEVLKKTFTTDVSNLTTTILQKLNLQQYENKVNK